MDFQKKWRALPEGPTIQDLSRSKIDFGHLYDVPPGTKEAWDWWSRNSWPYDIRPSQDIAGPTISGEPLPPTMDQTFKPGSIPDLLSSKLADLFAPPPEPPPARPLDFGALSNQLGAMGFSGAPSFTVQGQPFPEFTPLPGPGKFRPFQGQVPQMAAPTPVDFGPFEQALAAAAPVPPSPEELKQLQLNHFLQGLAQGASAGANQPVGTLLLQLGAGALGGHAGGKEAVRLEEKSAKTEQRQHQYKVSEVELQKAMEKARYGDRAAQTEFSNKLNQYNAERQGYEDKRSHDATALSTAQANAQLQNKMTLARFEISQPKITLGKKGQLVTQKFDPASGKFTIDVLGGGPFDQLAAMNSGGKKDAASIRQIFAQIMRENGPEGVAAALIEDMAQSGNLNLLLAADKNNNVIADDIKLATDNELKARGLPLESVGKERDRIALQAAKAYYINQLLEGNAQITQALLQNSPAAKIIWGAPE